MLAHDRERPPFVTRPSDAVLGLALAAALLAPACAIADPGAEPAPLAPSVATCSAARAESAADDGADERPGAPSVALSADTLAAWREHVLPGPAELTWAELPWLPSFREGVAAAGGQARPLLLWVMNGHPLGCT